MPWLCDYTSLQLIAEKEQSQSFGPDQQVKFLLKGYEVLVRSW